MLNPTAFQPYWAELWDRLVARQARLYGLQQDQYSDWRARKLLALRDSESVYYFTDRDREEVGLSYAHAWGKFTDELLCLYRDAAKRSDEPYTLGLEEALACQRGFHPAADVPALPLLLQLSV